MINGVNTLLTDILKTQGGDGTINYKKEGVELKDAALDFAQNTISDIEKNYSKNHLEGNERSKKLDYAEAGSITNLDSYDLTKAFNDMDIDGKKGISKEELASYIMAADSLTMIKDEKYANWEFLAGAEIDEDDLKKGISSDDKIDGSIDEDALKALQDIDKEELKEKAQEIYNENFKKKDNFIVTFFKNLFK